MHAGYVQDGWPRKLHDLYLKGGGVIRERIVNKRIGLLAQNIRDKFLLYQAVGRSLESLGTLANDSLARTLLERICRDDYEFIDIGAHIGAVIDGVRRNSKPSKITAFEAIPKKAAALQTRFPSVPIHCCAVSDRRGQASFYVDERTSGFSSLDPTLASRRSCVSEIVVQVERLDDLVQSDRVDLIKIDVEGAELGVLRGGETLIQRSRPTILFESGAEEADAFPKKDLWRWFDDHDYCVVVPNRVAHNDDGMGQETFLESHLYPRRTTNYYGIARERRGAIRDRARKILF